MEPGYIYHYSKTLYTSIQTRAKQGTLSKSALLVAIAEAKKFHQPGSYHDHVSFFFDPVPLKTLGHIFGKENDFWFNGNAIYEYCIEVNSLDRNIVFQVVETPKQLELLDNTKWEYTDEFKERYLAQEAKISRDNGETGTGLIALKRQIDIFKGKTEQFYLAFSKRKDFKDNIKKYASCVPHLMLYPPSGDIKIAKTNEVVVGSDIRKEHHRVAMESVKAPQELYQEEEGGTFESNGKLYDLNKILKDVHKQPIQEIEVSKLAWILKYVDLTTTEDRKRVLDADLNAPILVTKEGHQEVVVDGIHRLKKAVDLDIRYLHCRRVSSEIMKNAIIKITTESIVPFYVHW